MPGALEHRHFFISHTDLGDPWARELVAILEEIGLGKQYYRYKDHLHDGDWMTWIDNSLMSTRHLIAIWSPDYHDAEKFGYRHEFQNVQALHGDPRFTILSTELGLTFPPTCEKLVKHSIQLPLSTEDRERLKTLLVGLGQRCTSEPTPMFSHATNASRSRSQGWVVAPQRDPLGPLFKGRGDDLTVLKDIFQPAAHPHGRVLFAIHGGGGSGKTQLAREYAEAYKDYYSRLIWLKASGDRNSLDNAMTDFARRVDPQCASLDPEMQIDAAIAWLNKAASEKWLLILDNLDSVDAQTRFVQRYKHGLAGGHVLITSRLSQWAPGIGHRPLNVLRPVDAVGYLKESTEGARECLATDGQDIADVAQDLGYLPGALARAAVYVRTAPRGERSFAAFRHKWQTARHTILVWFNEAIGVDEALAAAWEVSLEQLADQSDAMGILNQCAWLASDPIPAELFPDLAAPLNLLENHSLIDWVEGTRVPAFSVHSVLQAVLQMRHSQEEQQYGWISSVQRAVHVAISKTTSIWDRSKLERGALLEQHFGALEALSNIYALEDPASPVLNGRGLYLLGTGQWTGAEVSFRQALALHEAQFGTQHPLVALELNNLAQLLKSTNRLVEAETLMRRALAIDEVACGSHHPSVARDLNNLGELLQSTNRMGEAESLMRRALTIDEAIYGAEHAELAVDLSNLATLLQAMNRLEEAEPLVRRVVTIMESTYGEEHPVLATALNNLGQLLQSTNCLVEAESVMRRALAIDETAYGPEHPDVAIDLSNLATLLQTTNRLSEAEPLVGRVAAIMKKHYGVNHPNVATALNNWAQLLHATSRFEAAEPLMRQALVIDELSYGLDHPAVAIDLGNLARLLSETNRPEEAEPMALRAFRIMFASLGPDHPYVKTAVSIWLTLIEERGGDREAELKIIGDEMGFSIRRK